MGSTDNPECPECGGPIGQTSSFCMHCSADLTDRHPSRDHDEAQTESDDVWMETVGSAVDFEAARSRRAKATAEQQELPPEYRSTSGAVDRSLVPDGFAIKAVTFLLAMAAGTAVGIGSLYVLSGPLAGWIAFPVGVVCWMGATAAFLRVVPG